MKFRGLIITSALLFNLLPTPSLAGTTGGIHGRVTDATTGAPVAGAKVDALSASQAASAVTDASGDFQFNSLSPDDYFVTVAKEGYGSSSSESYVFADQIVSLDLKLGKQVTKAQAMALGIVEPGVTSNFASIDAGTIGAFRGLQGNDSYDQTYAAMNSQPGIFSPQGQPGWYQRIYIRGGDQDQPGYEYDGIPVERRDWQSSPLINFSNLGVQELQVYTGGLLATSDATGIAGYVNEVVKSGTAPAYANFTIGTGGPMFYHSLQFEAGDATDNFSYYIGMLGANSSYRYVNQSNGAGLQPGYFFPVQLDATGVYCNAVPSGFTAVSTPVAPVAGMCFDSGQRAWNGNAGFVSAPGSVYGIETTWDRENVANFHFQIPHKRNHALKDDIQLLAMESDIYNIFQNSLNDFNGPWANVFGGAGFSWQDGVQYTAPVFQAPSCPGLTPLAGTTSLCTGSESIYSYPGSPPHSYLAAMPNNKGDYWSNGAAIVKLQYQWNINERSFLRAFGYTTYSDWLLNSPGTINTNYGLMAADWEPVTHTSGFIANYANQLNKHNYLTISSGYERTLTHGWSSFGLFGEPYTAISNLVDARGYCYSPTSGTQTSCYNWSARGTIGTDPSLGLPGPVPTNLTTACGAGGSLVGTAACTNSAQWMVTENGMNHLTWDATPIFTSIGFNDQWRPTDRWTFDVGFRAENFRYKFPNVLQGFPARQFWFNTYNNEHCFATGQPNIQLLTPVLVTPGTGGLPPNCAAFVPTNALGAPLYTSIAGIAPTNMTPNSPSSTSTTVYEPRVGLAVTLNRENVVRASYGVGARPPTTAWMQFGGQIQDLASFLGNGFSQYGFNSPVHALQPDRSYNLDATWEHEFKGTDIGFRITPYVRKTANQQQVFAYDAVLGLTAGVNVGHQVSSGVEFELAKGNFNNQGLSFKLAYTHNRSRIQYANFASGTNVIDQINYYVHQYNQYTQWCNPALHTVDPNVCGLNYTGANAQPTLGGVINPYYGVSAPATPFDRNASYTTYTVFPAPFYGDNGFEMPDFGSLTVNYRHGKWAVTPSIVYQSGSYYGNPLTWPGYDPASCAPSAGPGTLANPTSCTRAIFIPRTGTQFDQIGQFRQPSRWSGDMQISYDVNKRVRAHLTLMHIFDSCPQRGYAWDRSYVCEYSQLPSNVLPPIGNVTTLPLAAGVTPPPELKYPYGAWNINYNTDYQGVVTPFQANFSLEIKL